MISPSLKYSQLDEALVDVEKGPEEKSKDAREREAAETQLLQELWFNEFSVAMGDVTNMISILRNPILAVAFKRSAVIVCVLSLCAFFLSLGGRIWLRKKRDAAIMRDPRLKAEEGDLFETEQGI